MKITLKRLFLAPLFGAYLAAAAFAAIGFTSGCASAVGNQAIGAGEVLGGDVYTTAKLDAVDQTPAGLAAQKAAVTDLQLVASDLSLFIAGKLTQFQLGYLNGKLQADKVAVSGNQKAVDQVTGILNLLAQSATSGGFVTPYQALAAGQVTNIVSGINSGIQQAEGKWSATDPTGWTAPSS
jgi:hypothetical protein